MNNISKLLYELLRYDIQAGSRLHYNFGHPGETDTEFFENLVKSVPIFAKSTFLQSALAFSPFSATRFTFSITIPWHGWLVLQLNLIAASLAVVPVIFS
ncbi:hypothetical protein OROMI_028344 [Orobanche minor]